MLSCLTVLKATGAGSCYILLLWCPSAPHSGECVHAYTVMPDSCDPMDCSPPGSPGHGLIQARTWESVAISFSRGSSWPMDQSHVSCISCIGRQVLYHCATWEAHTSLSSCQREGGLNYICGWWAAFPFCLAFHTHQALKQSLCPFGFFDVPSGCPSRWHCYHLGRVLKLCGETRANFWSSLCQ